MIPQPSDIRVELINESEGFGDMDSPISINCVETGYMYTIQEGLDNALRYIREHSLLLEKWEK